MEHLKVRFLYVLQTYVLSRSFQAKCTAAEAASIMSLGCQVTPECLAGAVLSARAIDFADEGLKKSIPTWAVFEP
jgi:hypothetical protein